MDLTDTQKQHIFDMAVELLHEDVEHDQDYLDRIIRYYVSSQNTEVQLAMISSEEECQTELWGSDPQTGKEFDYEAN